MDKKIIVYALGKLFEANKHNIEWKNVVAVADKNVTAISNEIKVPCIKPCEIANYEYDYIAIFSSVSFDMIAKELWGEYGVPVEKIVSWKEILKDGASIGYDAGYIIGQYVKEKKVQTLLDVGMKHLSKSFLTNKEVCGTETSVINAVWCDGAIENKCLYQQIYTSCDEVKDVYDMILIDFNQLSFFSILENKAKEFVLYTKYIYDISCLNEFCSCAEAKGWKTKRIHTAEGILWVFEKDNSSIEKDIGIYVVMHKEYQVKEDDVYKPLCVGNFKKEGCLSEQLGDNISYLNNKINECTALYWIWKNTFEEYVGLNHYRRYFYNNSIKSIGNYMTKETIVALLEDYDIIFPETCPQRGISEYVRMKDSIDEAVFDNGYKLIREGIKKYQPDYLVHFDNVMNGYSFFPCNMFVTSREILNQYCEWLFSFLIEAAENIDIEGADSYSQRVIGFFAERMWTVWLRKQNLRIKQLPFDAKV